MASYLHPGVYIEELPSGSRPIEGVGTSTACFIGYVVRGPVGVPVLIGSWDDYVRSFGGLREDNSTPRGDEMGHAVSAFFMNGGTKAYIVRAITAGSAAESTGAVRDHRHHRPPDHRSRQPGQVGRRSGGALWSMAFLLIPT